ncbi:MAG TPA: phosphoglucomutase/phosphomannomutase family protein [Candidatus Polarisedimenticolia bacterium]|nr:phosphoglucomutase/phosphomannomutase family protein [Candidatus Polarisedimenticolia bacterium]
MPTPPIAFGASGWRGILGDDFTFSNVRRVTRAVARCFRAAAAPKSPRVFIGYDTRFLSEHFSREVASVLHAEGVRPVLSAGFVPTPAVSHAVLHGRFDGAIHLTGGHQTSEYHGMKIAVRDGLPAPPEMMRSVEAILRENPDPSPAPPLDPSRVKQIDAAPEYRKAVRRHFRPRVLARGRLKLVWDSGHGAGGDHLPALVGAAARVSSIRTGRDVTFGGLLPDCSERHLAPLIEEVRRRGAHLGLATDGDADRFGVVDRGGRFVPANFLLPLLADYLLETRRPGSGIARSVATTRLLDDVAALHGVSIFETPVGSQEARPLLSSGRAFLACEESAGMTLRGHVPENDGLLAGCLIAEMVAFRRKPLHHQIQDLFRRIPQRVSRREDYRLDSEQIEELRLRLENPPESLAGRKVARIERHDGPLLIFQDGSWFFARLSGTEPVARCYAEARSPRDLARLLDAGRALIQAR